MSPGVGSAYRLKTGEFHDPRQRFSQSVSARVPDVERVMGVRLGIFDHDPLIFFRAPVQSPRARRVLHPQRDARIQVSRNTDEITFDGLDAADPLHASDQTLDLFAIS